MNKKAGFFSLIGLSVLGFVLIVLQYKVTELSLEIPHLEEAYHAKKQMIEKLELDLRMLKSPKNLLEARQIAKNHRLVFPSQTQVLAVTYQSQKTTSKNDDVKTSINLPLAKVFP
jgi:hypothetical protein